MNPSGKKQNGQSARHSDTPKYYCQNKSRDSQSTLPNGYNFQGKFSFTK